MAQYGYRRLRESHLLKVKETRLKQTSNKKRKKNGHISVRKHKGRPFDREFCNNVFEKAVQECKLHNDLYEEIKAKVYGLGINQMEFTIGSPEFEQLRKKFEDISDMCYKLDKNFANFETYTSHLNSLKTTLDTVKGAVNDEDMEILKMTKKKKKKT